MNEKPQLPVHVPRALTSTELETARAYIAATKEGVLEAFARCNHPEHWRSMVTAYHYACMAADVVKTANVYEHMLAAQVEIIRSQDAQIEKQKAEIQELHRIIAMCATEPQS